MEIIAIVNQKGGVAKTTTTINLGACLAEKGKDVLLIDLDPQANLTHGLGLGKMENTMYRVLRKEISIGSAICQSDLAPPDWKGQLDLVPSSIELANSEIEFSGEIARETILKEAFTESAEILSDYDYILVDTNPSLGLLTVNALSLAHTVIIPLEPSIFALDGMEQLTNAIRLVKRKINEHLAIKGVLLTRVDGRTNIAKEFQQELGAVFGDKLFSTVIHQNVRLNEAQTESLPVNLYDDKATGTKEYRNLAKELVDLE